MSKQAERTYDVFISYSHTDQEWVKGWRFPTALLREAP